MEKSLFCLKCGAKLAEDVKICDNCKNDNSKSPNPIKIKINDISQKSCFNCSSKNLAPLMFIYHTGIPPGREGHNVAYAHFLIVECLDCGTGFIEKMDHDCWSYDEIWDLNEWYILNEYNMETLKRILNICPQSLSSLCTCSFHNALRSEIYSLPTEPWESVSKDLKHVPKFDKKHVHHVSLKIIGTLPKFELIKKEEE
ncbi:MAG: hypothetical protein ACFFDN_26465 [Candidatus Hodarchaeota archaeon]